MKIDFDDAVIPVCIMLVVFFVLQSCNNHERYKMEKELCIMKKECVITEQKGDKNK